MTGFFRFGKCLFFYGFHLALYKTIAAWIVGAASYVIEPPVFSKLSVTKYCDGPTGRRADGPTGRRDDGTTGRRDDGTTGRRDDGTMGRRDEGTTGRKDDGTTG